MKLDSRINASRMSWKHNIAIFLMILWCCGSYMGIYAIYMNRDDAKIYMLLSMAVYLVILSLFISFLFVLMRKIF